MPGESTITVMSTNGWVLEIIYSNLPETDFLLHQFIADLIIYGGV